MYLLLLFFLVFCFIRSIVAAAEYHVARTGSGSTCSQARPCSTIATGLSKMAAGDTLTIHAGTYDEYITHYQLVSGTDDANRTIIQAAPGETVTLTGIDTCCDLSSIIWVYGKSYITFDGLILDGGSTGQHLFYGNDNNGSYSTYITLQNSEVKNSRDASACVALTGGYHKIINNKVHDCNNPVSPGEHGIYISAGSGNWLVEGNEVYNVSDFGIHQYHTASDNTIIRYNYVHDVGSWGIIAGSSTNTQVYGNILVNTAGMRVAYSATNLSVWNNTMYANAVCAYINHVTNTTFKNNLCLSNTDNTIYVERETTSGIVQSDNTLSSDLTLLVDPANGNFNPRSGSSIIDGK